MSQLIHKTYNHERFRGKTRDEINEFAGGTTQEQQFNKQANLLSPLHEVFTLQHKHQKGFSLQERAHLR